jgi:glycosyltransferase involved in cell wall biosynthesis
MRLLYLHYGPQSGVTAAITAALGAAGVEVLQHNPVERFRYQLRAGTKLPNARPAVVRAVLEAMRLHGPHWKSYYLHSPYAFDLFSREAAAAIRRAAPDRVVQAGALFGPGPWPVAPYHLYLDHTRAIAERYPPAPGLPPAVAYQPEWRARERATYRNAEGIFTMSAFVKRSLEDDYGIEPSRVRVIGAGPNVVPPGHDPWGAPGPVEPREPTILFVGKRFVPKGGPELLEAFALVRREHPRARLALVSATCPTPLPAGVRYHGLLPREALGRLFGAAAVFALPTLREAFGLSLLEAMSFGLPVVASRIEAIPEIVSDGETGVLVPPRDPAALAAALSELLREPARARAMGAAGRLRLQARYGWRRTAGEMLEVLGETRPASGSTVPGELPEAMQPVAGSM